MDELRELMNLFQDITKEIKEIVIKEEVDSISNKLNIRGEIIKKLESYDKSLLQEVMAEFNIEKKEKELRKLMEEKKDKFKLKIQEVKSKKQMNLKYSKLLNNGSNLFNKKI